MDTEFTYGLDDLKALRFSGTPLAVVGRPISHSISPVMHNAAIHRLRAKDSRFNDWAYYRFDIAPEDLAEALPWFHKNNFLGINLTLPHKVQALELVQAVSPDAGLMGAVNTLVWGEHGYDGFNTDGYGLRQALREDLGVELSGATVMLLGSGGAARAAAIDCLQHGCARLYVGNRSPERLRALLEGVRTVSGEEQSVSGFALSEPPSDLPERGILINATSVGLKEGDPSPLQLDCLGAQWLVYDMIYNPPRTRLIGAALERGLPAANGLSMLVHQGARSLEIWSHTEVDAQVMMRAACHALDRPPRVL
jgi:shikimate dehydrogenase